MIASKICSLIPKEIPTVIGELPGGTRNIVAVVEYGGDFNTEYFGMKSSSATIFNPIIKIVARNSSYATGKSWMTTIKNALHRFHDEEILSSLIVGDVMYLGQDSSKLHEFQVTFNIQVKE